MKSIIICEGGTDLTLIQYYLEKTANWMYSKADSRDKSYTMKKLIFMQVDWCYMKCVRVLRL